MVRAFLSAVGIEVRGMHQAAYLLALFALLSQLLALVRDRLLASTFGASEALDLYYAAFRIPDLLFATVASLLSLYALLPVLSRLERQHEELVVAFMRATLRWFFVGMAVICGIAFVFVPYLVAVVAPGITDPAAVDSLVLLTRILLLQPILLGASNILANLTQLRQRFALYAVSPLLYNFGIIMGIVALYPYLGIAGLAWGVVLGAALHMLVQVPYFVRERTARVLPKAESLKAIGEVLRLSVPRTFALSAGQISLLVLTALASMLSVGSISVFMFAWNLQAVPLTIIGVSYSVAAFPTLSRLFAGGEQPEFLRHLQSALRHIMFWAVPATVLVVVLRAQLVRVILGSGAFDWEATRLVAAALALFALSLLAQAVSMLIARAYYAAGNTWKPLMFAMVDVVVAVGSAILLLGVFERNPFFRDFVESLLRVEGIPGTAVLMLALGMTLGAVAKFILGLVYLWRDFPLSLGGTGRLFFQSFCAAVIGGASAYAVLAFVGGFIDITTLLGIVLQGGLAGLAGLAAVALVLALLKSPELSEAYTALRRRLAPPRVAVEPTDVS